MAKYQIKYGIRDGYDGYDGCGEWEDSDATTLEDAKQESYESACQDYDFFSDFDYEAAEEEAKEALGTDAKQVDLDDYVYQRENEDRESCLDYQARKKPDDWEDE